MAKKKDKPQVINNIQELNLEIDYDKLAESIVKTNNKIETEKDRNYIISVFSGIVSFAALIVALVVLFKEVG